MLESNFGGPISDGKMAMLFEMCQEDGWTEERFLRTFKWFLKNKPYPAWTVADWFHYTVKVYPYEWYLNQCRPGQDVLKEMEIYRLPDGTVVYKWIDGEALPFEKLEPRKGKEPTSRGPREGK